jgi:hypothetical protein
MDQAGIRWIQGLLRKELKSKIEYIDCGYDSSSHSRRTNKKYKLEDFETINDFLNEPTGNTLATYISGHGFSAETWEDRCTEISHETLLEWLKEKDFYASLLDSDEMIDDKFWETLIKIDACDLAWLEKFRKLPFKSLSVRPLK